MRKIGLDIGDVRIGVAISDPMNIVANARETYIRKPSVEEDAGYFTEYARQNSADAFVLGLPVNMDGTLGRRAEITKEFGDKLAEHSGLKVFYQDERLTTAQAERMLIGADVRRDKRKQVVDKVAACLILQAFLDNSQNKF
ncbi:MAG TPA: Holliday junction resolvase RuvX [Eubacteriales bacterium]|nr:Holliday junction resolvase RuvX [Clostridia bacterium]HRR89425.1 Holliday junction resolvase RuvX [Eubacteriales bacterium]HRU84437.1 Holliday junction resolvase RuvX [Eubacteriales bacterium]